MSFIKNVVGSIIVLATADALAKALAPRLGLLIDAGIKYINSRSEKTPTRV